jgi:hypothetical protein
MLGLAAAAACGLYGMDDIHAFDDMPKHHMLPI